MSQSSSPRPQQSLEDEIADLREDIELNKGLFASLDDESDTESEESKIVIKRTLKQLKKKLKFLEGPSPAMATDQVDGAADSAESIREERPNNDNGKNSHLRPPTLQNLPNRKRQRGDLDDDAESRGSKSRKQSPNHSSANTPAATTDEDSDDYANNPVLSLLGHSREDDREQKRYLKELENRREERRRQEEEDAALAQRLQDEEDAAGPSTSHQAPTPKKSTQKPTSSSLYQQTLRGDGTYNKPASFSGPSRSGLVADVDSTPEHSGAATPVSSQDSLYEVSGDQFVPRVPGLSITGSQAVPGAYPGAYPGAQYINRPGGSVYGSDLLGGIVNETTAAFESGYARTSGGYAYTGADLLNARINPLTGRPNDPELARRLNPYLDFDADPAKTQDEIKDLLQQIRPDEELSDEQLESVPTGLSKTMMPHQISGLIWMKSMEDGTNKGGILADDMGLGKTLQAISLMLAHPAPADDRRPNLIVAPVALMHQWTKELEKFVRGRNRFSVLMLHGPNRAESYSAIRGYDIVLTTYGTLASELKRRLVYEDKIKTAADPGSIRDNCAILGTRSKFHRIILDEAQNIKNRNTKTAIAACRISATYRWCLSGTPMQNNVEEMYSLIRFCKIRPYNGWDKFSRDFVRPLKGRSETMKDRAMEQLQALLKAVLLRRTKKSKINGQPIIQLPDKSTVEDRVAFDKDQREFYQALEHKAQIQFNRYVRNGSIGTNYSNALVLLLRLRQACCHPALVTNSKDFEAVVNQLGEFDTIENAKLLTDKVVDRLKADEKEEGLECPVCMDACENATIFPCGHNTCTECFAKICENAVTSEEGASATCPHCRAKIDAKKITNWESFVRVYFPDREGVEAIEDKPKDDDDSDSDSSDEADDSDDDGDDLKDFIVDDDADIEHDSEAGKAKTKDKKLKRKSRSKGKGKAKRDDTVTLAQLRKQGLRSKAAKRKYLKRLSKDFVPSAKIEKTIELLEQIHDRDKGEKTIVFCSFTSFLDLLEVPLSKHPDFSVYSRYDGSMSAGARNDAVQEFTEKPNNRVILVSLKAGNAGLNLTAANHCIMLDPFWNPFIEYQAADRCYRIGQEKEVTVHRVLIGGGPDHPKTGGEEGGWTVEDRILALQEKKRALVEAALDERAGERIGRLGTRELGFLFGVNTL
jgi:SNF2 family DNA or RNA helicase